MTICDDEQMTAPPYPRPGDPVVAVASVDADRMIVYLYGRGVYAGLHPRPGKPAFPADSELDALSETITAEDDALCGLWTEMAAVAAATGRTGTVEAARWLENRLASLAVKRCKPLRERALERWHMEWLAPRADLARGGVVWGDTCTLLHVDAFAVAYPPERGWRHVDRPVPRTVFFEGRPSP
jgi:hypothetical protein